MKLEIKFRRNYESYDISFLQFIKFLFMINIFSKKTFLLIEDKKRIIHLIKVEDIDMWEI